VEKGKRAKMEGEEKRRKKGRKDRGRKGMEENTP